MSVRRLLICLALLFAAVPALAHPPAIMNEAGERAVAAEIEAFRAAMVEAIRSGNASLLREMYASSFVHTHGSGKQDGRDARIVSALAGDPVIETAPVGDLVIRIPNDWTAIVTGLSPVRSLADSKTYDFRWMAVYVRTEKNWALAASQATRLGETKR